jgi:hypothetical protein
MLSRLVLVSLIMLPGAVGSLAQAAEPPRCDIKLSVQLTPDVPNPRDPSFLSSLAGDPGYQLTWIRSTDTAVILELTGPGPRYRCDNEIARIRRDGRVLKADTLP